MKLKFKIQEFQTTAVNAVCDLFSGQEKKQATFSVLQDIQLNFLQNEFGIGNALYLNEDTILSNMQAVQKRNNLLFTNSIKSPYQFSIEMETGTGKTYVYIKTILELNKRYGFCKFIIVVPSVAIREGVYKSFEITKEHFSNQYDNVPYRFFIYNSSKLSDVRQFASSVNIEIMIINIDAFKKGENIINQQQDRLGGETAMRYIQDTNPVVIVDEPQSVDNTPKAKEAIASLNPLCVLRYSATHRDKVNLLYRLTPVDAYQMGLVKQIVVSSNRIENDFNKPYIRLVSVKQEGGFRARLEIDVQNKERIVSRKIVTVKQGEDLFLLSKGRELYEGYSIAGIDCTPGTECVEFTNTEVVRLGETIGGVDDETIKKAQIYRTIQAHLDKELMYSSKGIKVLSLFFIDEVKKYRTSDGEKGVYALMFEECYNEIIKFPKYAPLLKHTVYNDVTKIHNGYFSQDKKGILKDTKGDTIADYDTYNTIMKDKEWLLSFECPLRFIWSHSALKEGWDNPNVFQICTLIGQKSVFTCRQKIGRGLRLCVNQEGTRIEDRDINVLHVMANESFSDFANTLQREIEMETGIKFGVLDVNLFSGITYEDKIVREKTVDETEAKFALEYMVSHGYLTEEGAPTEIAKVDILENNVELPPQIQSVKENIVQAIQQNSAVKAEDIVGKTYTETVTVEKILTDKDVKELMVHFEKQDYITKSGNIKDTMKDSLLNGTLNLPQKFEAARERLEGVIINADQRLPIRNASREVVVRKNKQVLISPEFEELWNKIKQKTAYRVQINTQKLIDLCISDIKNLPPIPKPRIITQTADIKIKNKGVTHVEGGIKTIDLQKSYETLPHILSIIAEETLLKRDTIYYILVNSGRIKDFVNNPQSFLETVLDIISRNRHALATDGIKYVKLEGQEYFYMDIFEADELLANLDKNAVPVQHSVYDHVIYDSSTIERPFAVALDNDPYVKLFFKIPSYFKIETPIGTYNPDWAVYMNKDDCDKLYLIVETKGTVDMFNLRTTEQIKIHCGKEHFKALGNDISLNVATNWNELKIEI